MLDAKLLRSQPDVVAARLQCRQVELDTAKLQAFEEQRKSLQTETETLQAERNAGAKKIGIAKKNGEDVAPIMARMQEVNERLETVKVELENLQHDINAFSMAIPNLPHESVPQGKGEEDNVEVRRWGNIPQFDFEPKDHADLGEALGLIDFATATARPRCTPRPVDGSCILTRSLTTQQRGALQAALRESGLHVCPGERLTIRGLSSRPALSEIPPLRK